MINFIKEKKTIIFIILIIIILIGKNIYNSTQKYNNNVDVNQVVVNETKDEKEIEEKIIAVHITGAIKNAGVIRIEENSRIEDVIEKAGGLTEDADITNVNLAFIVEDGVKIRIPSTNDKDEIDIVTESSGSEVIDENDETSNGLININKASQAELETLNGIGTSLALKIIEYREQNGKFKTISDIKNVSGIGENKFNNIRNFIDV